MENMISMMTTEKPFERLQSLEQKINEVDKIQTIENYIAQIERAYLGSQGSADYR